MTDLLLEDSIRSGMLAIDARDRFDPDERRRWLNASEAGTCARKQFFEKRGAEKDERPPSAYMLRGHYVEQLAVDAIKAGNTSIHYAGDEQVTVRDEELRVSATPDGIIVLPGGLVQPEFKSVDPRTNRGYLPRGEHVWQVKIGMMIQTKQERFAPPFLRGELYYLDTSNPMDILRIDVPFDEKVSEATQAWVKKRAKLVLDTKNVERIPREGAIAGGRECAQRCAFRTVCGVEIDTTKEAEGNRSKTKASRGSKMDAAVRDYYAAAADKKDAEERQKAARTLIVADLERRSTKSLDVDRFHVELTPVAGRTTVDWKAAEKDGLDLEPYKKTGTASPRLEVKLKDA